MANRKDLTKAIAKAINVSQVVAKPIVDSVLEVIKEGIVSGDPVKIVNFGKFSVVNRAARKGRNPQTGEAIQIPAKKAIKFQPGKALADVVNIDWDAVEDEQLGIDEIEEEIEEIEDIEDSLTDLSEEDISEIVEIEEEIEE